MFESLKQFLPFLKGHYKKYIIAGIALLIVDIIDVSLPLLTGLAIDHIINVTKNTIPVINATKYLIFVGFLYILGVIIQGLLRYWWRYLFNSTSLSIAYDVRNKLFAHIQKLSLNFFHNARTGDIMSRATNDIEWIRILFGDGITIILDISFYLLLVPFIMFRLSPSLLLYTILSCIFLPFFVRTMGERLHKKSTQVQESLSAISQSAEENFSGVRVVKSFAQEENQLKRFEQTNDIYLKKNLSLSRLSSFFHPFFGFNVSICVFIILFAGGLQAIKGTMSPGDLVAFLQLLGRIIWPMAGVGISIMIYQRATASMERLQQIFNIQPEVVDGSASSFIPNGVEGPFSSIPPPEGEVSPKAENLSRDKVTKPAPQTSNLEVEFKNVDFSHKIPEITPDGIPKQDDYKQVQVIRNINLRIPPNSTVLITGSIGSGKTTLLHLICRFYDCDSGEILINGINIKEYPLKTLRSLIGFVPQDIFLFSEPIRENITFGISPNVPQEISNDMNLLKTVTESVRMGEFIESLPTKYETLLGERGVNLSGGQRQRLTLARALIAKPPILMLDDCFSSVDYETEQDILKNIITAKSSNQTTIIVSHRLAVMRMVDFIVFMDKGEIVEQGTPQELIAKNNAYAKFYEYQSIKKELDEIS